MRVRELMQLLKKCDPELEAYYDDKPITKVTEIKWTEKEKEGEGFELKDRVYLDTDADD